MCWCVDGVCVAGNLKGGLGPVFECQYPEQALSRYPSACILSRRRRAVPGGIWDHTEQVIRPGESGRGYRMRTACAYSVANSIRYQGLHGSGPINQSEREQAGGGVAHAHSTLLATSSP